MNNDYGSIYGILTMENLFTELPKMESQFIESQIMENRIHENHFMESQNPENQGIPNSVTELGTFQPHSKKK